MTVTTATKATGGTTGPAAAGSVEEPHEGDGATVPADGSDASPPDIDLEGPKAEGEEIPAVGRPKKAKPGDVSGDLSRLTETQRAVLADVKAKAKQRSDEARGNLVSKATGQGYSEADLDKVLAYVRDEAPIVISFNPDKALAQQTRGGDLTYTVKADRSSGKLIDAFLADTEYRNQFETGISSGSSSAYAGGGRDGWEKNIFENGYHTGGKLIAQERPKYGALNGAKYTTGPATSYGTCMLVLKKGVRGRVTFTPSNSSGCSAPQVGTIDNFQHVLNQTAQFAGIMSIGTGKTTETATSHGSYCEMQVHGPVEFDKDVEKLIIDPKHKGTPYEEKLLEFAKKNGIPVGYHGDSWTA